MAREQGLECVTLHVGWGLEDDTEMDWLTGAVLDASDLRFNCDFSHWYTGLEMVYGAFERKREFIRPVIERGRFVYGRIGNPGSMQLDIGEGDAAGQPLIAHFRTLWTAVFANFLESIGDGEMICFAAELLGPDIYYARRFSGREESDRWHQSLVLTRIARECFAAAKQATRIEATLEAVER